jgi:hypothetical protein
MAYMDLGGRANVVVDGSPTDGTVLTLTHWPGYPPPEGLGRDLSAQMAFAYQTSGVDLHSPATLVSNNHFDQDGLVSIFALARPEAALTRRALLEDVAGAGDFGCFTSRTAARISMALAAFADDQRSPLALMDDYPARTGQLYSELLGLLPDMCDHIDTYQDLWGEEDAALTESERLIASGQVKIIEYPEVDLAVVDVPDRVHLSGGHLFAHQWAEGVHPMAIHNATGCYALLVRQGHCYQFRYRYESWVQYRSRPVPARRDLSGLAAELTALEPSGAEWAYEGSGSLTPTLRLTGTETSRVGPDDFLDRLIGALESGPANWDPFQPRT